MKIKTKILFWFLLPSILIAVVIASFCYFYTRETIKQNIFDQLEIAADILHGHIHVVLREKRSRTIDFSSDGFIRDCIQEITEKGSKKEYYTNALNTHLAINKQPLDPDILELFVVGLDGKVISSTDVNHIGKNISSDAYFLASTISDLHYSPEFKQNVFDIKRLISSKDGGKPIGIIVILYRGDIISQITRSGIAKELDLGKGLKGLRETGEVYIVNSDKLMITESRFIEDAILRQAVDTEGVRSAFDNGVGMIGIYNDYRGAPILGVSRYIEEMDWVVLAEKDATEAFAPIARLRNFTIIMGIIGITVIAIVAIFLARGITMPIKKLIEGTRRVAGGDLEHLIEIGKRNDETKELSESFNLMIKDLNQTIVENKQLFLQEKESKEKLDEKAMELKKINEELEDFVYIISHDLKEPLFSIEGYRSRLLRSCNNILDEKSKSHLERIKVNIENMSKKIYEIMEVLKVGRVVYNFENNNVQTIVNEVLKILESKITENNVNVINQDNIPVKLMCDKERLKDVFSNLIINAVKFMCDDKKREIRIGCEKGENYYKFFVEDTGIGIRPEYQDQIFKIFRRLNDVEKEGSGVGLAIVKKIVEIHNGKVWVESPVNDRGGSKFCFTMPISKSFQDSATF